MNENRRNVLKAAAGALAGAGAASAQTGSAKPEKKVYYLGPKPAKPLFSSAVSYGNLLFIALKVSNYFF